MECARDNFESDSDDDEVESNPGSDVSRGWGDKRAVRSGFCHSIYSCKLTLTYIDLK